jgi:23S rRNA (cytidine1920-2'-O)/16S rRNA (cytidine1409-2'-O)-methyltransferase
VEALLLIKPQFEVGRQRVGKGGVVRDPLAHQDAINRVIEASKAQHWQAAGLVASPITGPAGNHEYLIWLVDLDQARPELDPKQIGAIVGETLAGPRRPA